MEDNFEKLNTAFMAVVLPEDKHRSSIFRAFLGELFGTAMFIFMGCGSVAATGEFLVDDTEDGAQSVARVLPIAATFGLSIVVLAFNLSAISGGHLNPAVTFSLLLLKQISFYRALVYVSAQFLGGIGGALLVWGSINRSAFYPHHIDRLPGFRLGIDVVPEVGMPPYGLGANQVNPVLNNGNALLLETVGTAILIVTVLSTAIDQRSLGRVSTLAPIPIGFVVFILHLVLVPWTGCGINAARTFGPALVNSFFRTDRWGTWWWIYYVGNFLGALLGTGIIMILWGSKIPPSQRKKVKVDEVSPDIPLEGEQTESVVI